MKQESPSCEQDASLRVTHMSVSGQMASPSTHSNTVHTIDVEKNWIQLKWVWVASIDISRLYIFTARSHHTGPRDFCFHLKLVDQSVQASLQATQGSLHHLRAGTVPDRYSCDFAGPRVEPMDPGQFPLECLFVLTLWLSLSLSDFLQSYYDIRKRPLHFHILWFTPEYIWMWFDHSCGSHIGGKDTRYEKHDCWFASWNYLRWTIFLGPSLGSKAKNIYTLVGGYHLGMIIQLTNIFGMQFLRPGATTF